MSEFHNMAIRDNKAKDVVNEDEIRFYEEMLHKERVVGKQARQELAKVSGTFDKLFLQAQEYIKQNPNDTAKVDQLLSLFDQEHRELLLR